MSTPDHPPTGPDPGRILAALPAAIREQWGREVVSAGLLEGGMNSVTARVELADGGVVVAKWVRARSREELEAGARTAALVEHHGILAGAPVPTTGGPYTVVAAGGALALLRFVDGAPLTGSEDDQRDWGRTLATLHGALPRPREGVFFPWIAASMAGKGVEERDRRAVATVLDEFSALPPLTWALLHTDPEPGAFLRTDAGEIGVIDWTGSTPGPALYDLASAVMYAGGEVAAGPLIEAYRSVGAVPGDEIDRHLRTLGRFRAAVQVAYFSQRLREGDLTGIASHDENRTGLEDGRGMLRELGVRVA